MSWNELNTFSKLIYPYLEEELGYPERKSHFFDEQTYVRKKGKNKGPYDGTFIDAHKRVLLLLFRMHKKDTLGTQDPSRVQDVS